MRLALCCLLLVACGGNPGPENTTPAGGAPPAGPPMRTFERTLHALDLNGTRLAYRVTGDSGAAPVVFVHGSLGRLEVVGGPGKRLCAGVSRPRLQSSLPSPNPQVNDDQAYSPKLHL